MNWLINPNLNEKHGVIGIAIPCIPKGCLVLTCWFNYGVPTPIE